MTFLSRISRRKIVGLAIVVGLSLIWLLAFHGEVVYRPAAYYSGDIARVYYPQHVALRRALRAGRLPWWTTELGAGYPLLAEGQVGALYPLNWIIFLLWPADLGLSVSIIVHALIAALGSYLFARRLSLGRGAALISALTFAQGGFLRAHLTHVSIFSAVAWLPWLLAAADLVLSTKDERAVRPGWRWTGLTVVVALQFLAGHPQMSLLILLVTAGYVLVRLVIVRPNSGWAGAVRCASAVLAGVLLSAPQWLPTLRLALQSQRAGGLDSTFFTSYSFHPLLIATYLWPFARGNPYPEGSVELMVYVGWLPLVLAAYALWRRRRTREVWCWLALAGLGLFLAVGRWNPLYRFLQYVPLLNLFRAPARYLLWTSMSLSILAGIGTQELFERRDEAGGHVGWLVAAVAGAGALCTAVVLSSDVDVLVRQWRWMPLIAGVLSIALVLRGARMAGSLWLVAALLLLLADLWAYDAVLDGTYDPTWTLEEIRTEPVVVEFLQRDLTHYRIYTKEEILPAQSVMRASLYPNMALGSGVQSANVDLPLLPRSYGAYLEELTPAKLDRLNVKYYLIPQLLPVTEEAELYDVRNPYSDIAPDTWLSFNPVTLSSLEIESYLSHSVGLTTGTEVARLHLRTVAGEELSVPLRAGEDTAEWAYERPDVAEEIAHALPEVASSWPARSGFPPTEHPGHTYLSRWDAGEDLVVDAVKLELLMAEAFVRVERVRFCPDDGACQLLCHLTGKADHQIVYRSEDVLVYRNEDLFPRAYVVAAADVTHDANGISLEKLRSKDAVSATITDYAAEQVVVQASVSEESYIVLADQHYPGWWAWVDGEPVDILKADGIYRAVPLEPGEHSIRFRFRPFSFRES